VPFVATTAFALHSARNIPLWALSGLPLLVAHLDTDWKALTGTNTSWPSRLLDRLSGSFALAAGSSRAGLWATLAAAAGVVLAVRLPPHPGFDPAVFPVEAVARARASGLTGRIFNELAWGGYILYAWPEQKVFIDAQTDFYGEPLSQEYYSTRSAQADWESAMRRWRVSLVLLPSDAPLASVLSADDRWEWLAPNMFESRSTPTAGLP
jgi:hypothetical protein